MSLTSEESEQESSMFTRAPSITNYLDGLTNPDLIKTVEDLEIEILHLELENEVFEHFLLKNDPTLIAGMQQVLEAATKLQNTTPSILTSSVEASSKKTDSAARTPTAPPTIASGSDRGPRINLSQKMDLVLRESEDMQLALKEFLEKSHRTKCILKAELEEMRIRESEVTEAREIYEQKVIIEGTDPLTQRIPAEKFLRYMEEWLRSAESIIGKLRLRTSTLKNMIYKLSSQLVIKQELGENIDAVDFDQLKIENLHLGIEVDQKNTHLLELKKMNGIANLVLSTNKKYLQKQVEDFNALKNNIKFLEQRIITLDKEAEGVQKEMKKSRDKYADLVYLNENYRVPNTLDYIKTKAELIELSRNVKMWGRRINLQQSELNIYIRQMKRATGLKKQQPSWFEIKQLDKEDTSLSINDSLSDDINSSLFSVNTL